ncbi:MAG: APC family permease [Actinomycetes bacterium]
MPILGDPSTSEPAPGRPAGSPTPIQGEIVLPEPLGYRLKRRLLGPPLTNYQLKSERLSKTMALGVLSSDMISSSAYGTEEMLLILLPLFGMAAYTILLPMTAVVLGVLILVTLSYRQVVTIYTKAGGSYVVARENFGPRIAQIAAVALMIDYIVTVAVQASAGTAAITSALPRLTGYSLEITVGVVLVLFFGNLRGIREAGRAFAFPTYFFAASVGLVIVVGIIREALGDLPLYNPVQPGAYSIGHGSPLLAFGAIYILLKAFANGGSSLTGLEAISNGVSAFKPPEGVNARRTLVVMSVILGTLVAGVSWLAHQTHAVPYYSGSPTVISQVAEAVFGHQWWGRVLFYLVQLATMLILYTGANTPFNGFPFLTSFVAEDSFLPRQLSKRGHRLAFSNGIIVLTVLSLALLIGVGAHVEKLIAFYAIGVFTGFTMAGFGMAKHFHTHRGPHWQTKLALNFAAGAVSLLIVVIFAVVKFTEGAWLVVLVFPTLVFALMRLNRRYRAEAQALEMAPVLSPGTNLPRHVVVVLVDDLDLAVVRAMRYARSLKPAALRVVHFVIDADHARELQARWTAYPGVDLPLELIDCPDRRIPQAAVELASRITADNLSEVSILLPRRSYSALVGRLLHDRTADNIAQAISRVRRAAATIVPFDVDEIAKRLLDRAAATADDGARERAGGPTTRQVSAERARTRSLLHDQPIPTAPDASSADLDQSDLEPEELATTPIGRVRWRQRVQIEGQVRTVRVAPVSGAPALELEVFDDTGGMSVLFYGRRSIPGIEPGRRVRIRGRVGAFDGHLAVANPTYELLPSD